MGTNYYYYFTTTTAAAIVLHIAQYPASIGPLDPSRSPCWSFFIVLFYFTT